MERDEKSSLYFEWAPLVQLLEEISRPSTFAEWLAGWHHQSERFEMKKREKNVINNFYYMCQSGGLAICHCHCYWWNDFKNAMIYVMLNYFQIYIVHFDSHFLTSWFFWNEVERVWKVWIFVQERNKRRDRKKRRKKLFLIHQRPTLRTNISKHFQSTILVFTFCF